MPGGHNGITFLGSGCCRVPLNAPECVRIDAHDRIGGVRDLSIVSNKQVSCVLYAYERLDLHQTPGRRTDMVPGGSP